MCVGGVGRGGDTFNKLRIQDVVFCKTGKAFITDRPAFPVNGRTYIPLTVTAFPVMSKQTTERESGRERERERERESQLATPAFSDHLL